MRDTQRQHPMRIPAIIIVVLLTLGISINFFYNPKTPLKPYAPDDAKANTYQFTPTSGTLVTGTDQNAVSTTLASTEGVNTGSWKGTLSDDNFHWIVTAADAGTPNLNMQLDLGNARLTNTNKLVIQTEFDMDSASRLVKVQICDWVSSTSVDAAADSQCTTGGWRSLNSQTAANADVDIAMTTAAAFQWHIFDGYFSTGTTGGTAISTPLTNFTSSDTQPLRIRYWSDSDVVGSGDVAVDFLRASAFMDTVYQASSATNLNGSGGALAGTYTNTHITGNTATAQQPATTGNTLYLTGAGTAGSVADYYTTYKNVVPYTGANTFYFKADYSCSAATAGLDIKFAIYNFATPGWEDLVATAIACSTTDATNAWAKNNITPADYIDEAAGDEVRIRFYGDLNSTTTLRIDFSYLMLGSTNTDTAQCEVTWGSGTATNCSNTRNLDGTAGAPSLFSNTSEDRSATADNDYYPGDCVANATTTEECAASNMNVPVTVPTNGQVIANHYAGRYRAQLNSTDPDLLVRMDIRDYSGVPTSVTANGGWTAAAAASTAGTFVYADSMTALAIGTYGNQTNPDDHVDTTNNIMNLRLRTGTNGTEAVNNIAEWDFGMASIAWVVDSSHPTRNYQFAPTGDTLVVGSETTRNAEVVAATSGVNTGGWQGTLGDDNMHWSVNGANVVGVNHDMQLNFATAKQNGANELMIQSEIDTDATLGVKWQICDWVSSTSVDFAADAQCTGGGWRTINSKNASNVDIDMNANTTVTLTWAIYDGYFTTGATGGTAISTPLTNFFHSSNGVKIRIYNAVQTSTAIDVDFIRISPMIDTIYHPAGITNLNTSGGALAGTYVNATAIGNQTNTSINTASGDNFKVSGAGTAGSIPDYYLSFRNIKPFTGANTIYLKAEYSCSTTGINHKFAIYNFTSAAWEDLNSAAIACSATDAVNAWAKNNITLSDYVNGGETRIRFYGSANSTLSLQLDTAYIMIGATNTNTADCQITFGSGTATNCSNTRTLDGPATPSTFDNTAEDESATMGTGDSNAYYAMDNATTADISAQEATSSNISFAVTQPTNSSIVGEHFAARFAGCSVCTTTPVTVQAGFKDYSGFNQATGGWLQVGATSATATQALTDTVIASGINVYGQQNNPEDYIDTANNKINLRLRTTTPGLTSNNAVTAWDFALVSIQWIEIGSTIDISGSSSVSGATVAVAIDGLFQVGKTAATSGTCPCAWTISSVFAAGGRPVVVWHDGAADADESTGITKYDGSGNITGLDLTVHQLAVGSADNQTITYSELVTFDNDADEDVMFKAVSSVVTVDATSAYSDEVIDILDANTLVMGGTETLNTFDLDINGTLTSGGATTYNVEGFFSNTGTAVFNEGTSTVNMIGTTAATLNTGCSNTDTCTDENLYNLTINKTSGTDANDDVTITGNGLRVTNLITITDGELVQGALNIRAEGTAAVSVGSAGKWSNISTGDIKLGGTVVNAGYIYLSSGNISPCSGGTDSIAITSTVGGTQRNWSGAGSFALYNLSVTDMTDSAITAYQSTFSNSTWTNGSCTFTVTISGNAYADHATTPWVPCDGTTANLSLVVDAINSATTTTCADATGAFSFVGVNVNPLAPITIFMNSNGGNTDKGAAVTMLPIAPTSFSLNVRKDIVWVTHDAGVSSISNADVAHCSSNSPAACADMPFSRSGNNITVSAGYEVHVQTGKTYAMGFANLTAPKLHVQGTLIGGAAINITGTGTGTSRPLYIDGGSYTAATQTNYQGDGDVELQTVTYDTLGFSPTITAARAYTSTAALTVNGNFTLNPNASLTNYLTFTLGGNIVMPSTATLQVRGTSAGGSILDTSGSNYSITTGFMSITNNGVGGTLVANGSTITLTGTSLTLWSQSGTFTPGTSTVVMNPDASILLTGNTNITFYNLSLTPTLSTSQTYTFGNNPVTINGDFLIQPSGSGLLTVNTADHINVASTKTTTISRSGSATSLLDLHPITVDFDLTTGFLNIGAGGTLKGGLTNSDITLQGTSGTLFTNAGTYTPNTSKVTVGSASGSPTFLSGATTFHRLALFSTATVINMGSAVTINNVSGAELNIDTGVFNVDANDITGPGSGNGTFTIGAAGAFCLGGTTAGTNATCDSGATQTVVRNMPTFQTYAFNAASTVYYLTNSASTQTMSATPAYGNLNVRPTITGTRTYAFDGAVTINGDFTIAPGNNASNITVNAAGTITVASGKTTTLTRKAGSGNATLDMRPASTDYDLITGFVNIGTGGTLDFTAASSTTLLTGTSGTLFTRAGTYTPGTSAVSIASASGTPTFLSGATTFHQLIVDSTATVINMGSAVTINNVTGAVFVLTNGVFNIDAAAFTGPGTTNGVMTVSNNSVLCIGGTTNATNATCDSGATQTTARTLPVFSDYGIAATTTVRYLNDAATTVSAPEPYGNLQLAPALTADRTYTLGSGASEALSVAYDGTRYIAAGYETTAGTEDAVLWYSTDLQNWTKLSLSTGVGNQKATDIIYANSKYIVSGYDSSSGTTKATVWESSNFTLWFQRTVYATASTANAVIWDATNSKYVVAGNDSTDGTAAATAWESTNLTSWTIRTVGGVPVSNAYDIIWDSTNSKYVMAGTTTSLGIDGLVWESTNLTAWTARNVISSAGTDELKSVIFEPSSGKYVVGGYESGINAQDAKVWESTNLTAWTSRSIEATTGDQQVFSVIYDSTNSKFIVAGRALSGSTYAARIWESTNLTSWTTRTLSGGEAGAFAAMYDSANGRYVAVGVDMSGVVAPGVTGAWTSTNLTSWSPSSPSIAVEVQGDFTLLPSGSSSTRTMTVQPEASVKVANTKTMTLSGSGTAKTDYKLKPFFVHTKLDTGSLSITSAGAGSKLDGGTSGTSAINVAGDYTNNGTFTASNTTVTLNGTSKQTLTGDMTSASAFYNLMITNNSGASASDCELTSWTPSVDFELADATVTNDYTIVTPNVRVEYDANNTYTFTNINWNGQASGTRIYFRNSTAGIGVWLMKVTGTQTVSYVNVSRSDASVSGGSTIMADNGTNVDCNNNSNWDFVADPVFNQVNYRFGSGTANNISYSGAPAENAPLTVTSTGQDFRLRMAINVTNASLSSSGQSFKLQFGEKPDGGCSLAVFGDVDTASGVIRYVDIAGLANSATISTVAGDPNYTGTDWPQIYKESNNFTNSTSSIGIGENGVWDFSLENNSSLGSKHYCFRIADSGGGALATYTQYPEVIIDEELTFSLDNPTFDFGLITPGGLGHAADTVLSTTTNASGGYQVRIWSTQLLTDALGNTIPNWTGTNTAPTDASGAVNNSYFMYSTTDSNLGGGTADRFTNPSEKYAGFALTGPGDLVADNTTTPVVNNQFTVRYGLFTKPSQAAGKYTTTIIYINSATY